MQARPNAAQNPLLRHAIACGSLGPGEIKQRRKRSRVNPDQLLKLEEYFAADNSPTSARRRDIARELGMDERQTQIWFQNRSASAFCTFARCHRSRHLTLQTRQGQAATQAQGPRS